MEKAIFNKSGMKQIVNSGYKLFDNQTNCITTGNVMSNTQYSSYIRPYKEVVNGYHIGKQGDFLKFDMKNFNRIPKSIKNFLTDENRVDSVILYEFFVNRNRRIDVIGYVLTDKNHNLIKYYVEEGNWYFKREMAIREAMKYICNSN